MLISLISLVLTSYADIRLPSLFSNNMVLQQQSNVNFWGYAIPSASVTLTTSWNNKTYQIQADSKGRWQTQVNTPIAGGPYTIRLSDGKEMTLKNILIGEVWVCSGQSNMEMPMRGNSSPILNANEIISNAANPELRLFHVQRATSLTPQEDSQGQWEETNPASAREFSALAYQFGEKLQRILKVPVGLVLSTVGGTMIESWMSAKSLQPFPEVAVPKSLDTVQAPHKLSTTLFNGMIAPLTHYPIKGFIWFQGESNRHEAELYERLFPAMVSDWRQHWNLGDLPFYYVQIAPLNSRDATRNGPRLREAQLNASLVIPNCGMVSALDVGMEHDVHFMDKTTLAQRLSYWALGHTYHIAGINYKAPLYKAMEIEGSKAVLTFDYAPYLTAYGKTITLFEVAGADRRFFPAKASIKANQVTVYSDEVPKPIAVRYAYKEWVEGELYNNDGLPASSFRTDNW